MIITMKFIKIVLDRYLNRPLIIVDKSPWCKWIMSAVERFFGWLKSFRRIIIRYEKLASTYKALVTIASIIIT